MKSYTPNATERPRDDSVFQVVITETVLPFGNGKATLVWVDADDPDTLVTHPAIDESNPDRQIEVYDANDCNCLLPGELVWIRFDEEIGAYVPEGSQGLVRKAVAQADVAADAVGTFSIAKDGEVITFPDGADPPVDQSVDIDVKSVHGATDQTLYFVVYLRGDQSPGGDVNRLGRWETITESKSTLKVVTDNDVSPGNFVSCTVWEGQPPMPTNRVIEKVWLDWETGGEGISADKQARITYDTPSKVWRFISAECEGDAEPAAKGTTSNDSSVPASDSTAAFHVNSDGVWLNDGNGTFTNVTAPAP